MKKILIIESCIIILIVIICVSLKFNINTPCYINEKYGMLCPSCGGTRTVKCLVQGDIKDAILIHPVFTVSIIYLFFVNILYIINHFRKNKIALWFYPNMVYLIIFLVSLVGFTIIRNIV